MANREKKITLGKKQATASPVPPKEETNEAQNKPENTNKEVAKVEANRRKFTKKSPKKVVKRTFRVNLKAKGKIVNSRLGKGLLSKTKGKVPVKKALLKNGVAKSKVIRKKALSKPSAESDDKPPVLEPIFPLEDNIEKKSKKKLNLKKSDDGKHVSNISATIESIINQVSGPKLPKRVKLSKKVNATESVSESIEDVVNRILKSDEIKKDLELVKSKKLNTKKMKIDAFKRKLKKENIENTLSKIDTSKSNVIDMLDLNVGKVKSKTIENRRHSIEKFPITSQDVKIQSPAVFSNIPRSISPKVRRNVKLRQSVDSKRSSPYTTRSDSPLRLLRNGKQRKLKHLNLLDGLDSEYKKRRRLCSDYSGSEVSVSKLSGYESDSSYSDLASLPGVENNESIEKEVKKEMLDAVEMNSSDVIDADSVTEQVAAIKRSLSSETTNKEPPEAKTDTNSNLCSDSSSPVKTEDVLMDETISPSFKVPEKSIILGIMKQTFNDIVIDDPFDSEKRKTRSSARKNQKATEEEPSSASNDLVCKETEASSEPAEQEAPEEIRNNGDVQITELENQAEEEPAPEKSDEIQKGAEEETVEPKSDINCEINISNEKESDENLAIKTQILQALGLQSLQDAEEAKLKLKKIVPKNDNYTGTLKTVIKLNRFDKKKNRNSLKMTLQKKGKSSAHGKEEDSMRMEEDEYKIMKDGSGSAWKSHHGSQSSDTAGAQRKSHYYNRSNMDGSSEHTSDGDSNANEDGSAKVLVIPEKASSFSIHPGRLCKDECSYCFGKFGLFDTPCHIAQMKSVERQNKILGTEKHLTRDSCLCDACYRHVDRKANTPSYASTKSIKRNNFVAPGPRQNHCHVLGCGRISSNILRRKWLIKMRKSVCQVINIDLDNPGLHSIPICEEHYAALEHLMVCAMCKRKLARNHIHYLGTESNDLNTALNEMRIPVKLNDRPVVCKLCRYFATMVLKNKEEERTENTANFFREYRKRLLHFHDVEIMDESQAEEPIPAPVKEKNDKESLKKKKKLSKSQTSSEPPVLEPQVDIQNKDHKNRISTESRPESPPEFVVDFNTLLPNIAIECGNNIEITRREVVKKSAVSIKRVSKSETVKESIEKSKKMKNNSDIAVQRLGSNPSISVRQLFPGEEDLQISGNIEFHNVKERTPEGWEKCISTIQYDPEVKMLWNELQKPYGNQSSFLRHLILLEKYFRNGDLILSPNATHHSVNYTESVQNRLKAYDNIPSNVGPVQPLSMIPFNKSQKNLSGLLTSDQESSFEMIPQTVASLPTVPSPPPPSLQRNQSLSPVPSIALPLPLPTPPQVPSSNSVTVTVTPTSIPKTIPATNPQTITTTTTTSIVTANNTSNVSITPSTVTSTTSSFLVPNPTAIVSIASIPVGTTPTPSAPIRPKLPPSLISLKPGTKIPVTPLVKVPQSQKIKFPITKNWRPTLIPIDPTKKPEKKPGLVQVISGGKPYHITIEDYKKMCAIKRTFDLRQKRLQEAQRNATNANSILKSIPSRKGLIISKTSTAISPKADSNSDQECENSLEKLDKTVEKLESKLNDKPLVPMPKIPKSLTVIPQTVTKKTSRPSSPTLLITPKTKSSKS